MFYSTNQSYQWILNQWDGRIQCPATNQNRVTSFTSASEQYIRWQNRHWYSGLLTDHDDVHLWEMRQSIYREEQPDQTSKDPCSFLTDLFLWGMRADTRNRHEAAHSYSLTCGVCGQYFNRLDILARHRALHERPEAKQRLPMKRPAAPESGPSPKQRRTVSPPTNTHQEKSRVAADAEVLLDDPETRTLYRQHWQSIRTEESTGNVSKTCTTLPYMRWQHPPLQRWFIGTDHRLQDQRVVWFYPTTYGNRWTSYYHSSQNNSRFFYVSHLIRTEEDLWGQPMLFPMPGRTSWNSSDGRRSSSQDVLPPVSTTPRHDPCRLQGCGVGWFGGIGAVVQRLTRNRSWWHRSTIGTPFSLQLPRDHEFEPVRSALQLRQWYGEVQPQFPVFQVWPVVETCWEAAQTWTNLYRRCQLQVSWWRVPYNTDCIRPVRRRRHRRLRRRPILPVQSYLWHRSDATAYWQETIREVGMDQSSRTTQRVCMFQRSVPLEYYAEDAYRTSSKMIWTNGHRLVGVFFFFFFCHHSTRKGRTRALMGILPRRGPEAFHAFCCALLSLKRDDLVQVLTNPDTEDWEKKLNKNKQCEHDKDEKRKVRIEKLKQKYIAQGLSKSCIKCIYLPQSFSLFNRRFTFSEL